MEHMALLAQGTPRQVFLLNLTPLMCSPARKEQLACRHQLSGYSSFLQEALPARIFCTEPLSAVFFLSVTCQLYCCL